MSMILDALRKSETERRRAQAPDLFAEPALAMPTSARGYPQRLWGMLAAAVLIVVAVWVVLTLTTDPARVPASTRPVPATTTDEANATLPAPEVGSIEAAAMPVASTAPRSARPTADPPSVPSTVAAPAIATAPPPPPPNGPTALPTAPAPVASMQPAPREPVAIEPARPAATPMSPALPPGGPLRIADLSVEDRQQLPPLKMSMHLWNPAAAQRFVILDGTRAAEGDSVGDVVVEQITADGVVLSWRGRRLKLPIR